MYLMTLMSHQSRGHPVKKKPNPGGFFGFYWVFLDAQCQRLSINMEREND